MFDSDCAIEMLPENVDGIYHVHSSQHEIALIQYSAKKKACTYSAHAFLPILFGVCADIIYLFFACCAASSV